MNRKQFIQKVESLGCTVEIDLEDGRHKTVHITAPMGKNFGGNHEEVTAWQSGSAPELYADAFKDLQSAIVGLQECDHETCGAWIEEGAGYCEYWDV